MSRRTGDPLVFAHRGSSATQPEHTLAAYLHAIEEGADGLECDVRLTRDGHLVCLHDRRLERTSNGRGLVSEHTLAELNELDFGSWHPGLPEVADELILRRAAASAADSSPSRVSTWARCSAVPARPVRLLIETKHPTRYGNAVEERLVATLTRYGLHRPDPDGVHVSVMSFSFGAVRRCRVLAPELPTVLLLDLLPPWLRDGSLPEGVRVAGPGVRLLRARPRLARRLHERGHRFYVWTVNTDEDLDLVLDLDADGVITDRPRFVLDRLGR